MISSRVAPIPRSPSPSHPKRTHTLSLAAPSPIPTTPRHGLTFPTATPHLPTICSSTISPNLFSSLPHIPQLQTHPFRTPNNTTSTCLKVRIQNRHHIFALQGN
ncbi:hypothetical protein L207DRAFT_30388 [Hyaloscypha variabilis F]|uniref:Uncharacterized protein n=1 Tax=Hyaloscypha variabilis (strain UAMH 11265 / GT02V1 / F) TaxID=1149755 RepID=A0A2J6RMU0_HYAVF|nr:hypothetical protein L207DRAFT_30388 [Hyaloscypha variabilis F]